MSIATPRLPVYGSDAATATQPQADILLIAINARHSHCSHAGRTLIANLGSLRPCARLLEFETDSQPLQIAACIAVEAPRIAAFPVYLWNTRLVRDILAILARVAPDIKVALGGPEIVPGCVAQWQGLADALVRGEGELALRDWCRTTLGIDGRTTIGARPASPVWIDAGEGGDPGELEPPGDLYTDDDIRHRVTYVEASRGCPHHCLYCTSGGSGLRLFPLPPLFDTLQGLLNRGMLHFRFLDRTFNAAEEHACAVLDFFLQRLADGLKLHIELAPNPCGPSLRRRLEAFPAEMLHIEVGVQSLNEEVARRVGRTGKAAVVMETLEFLVNGTGALVHADLIFGLPGEDERSFAEGFDRLAGLGIPEIQVNRLKGLPGTPILRLPELAGRFSPVPPYDVLCTDQISFADLARIQRFAYAWERLHNRGHFRHTLPLLWRGGGTPYAVIRDLAEAVYERKGRVHALGRHEWALFLVSHMQQQSTISHAEILAALRQDEIPANTLNHLL